MACNVILSKTTADCDAASLLRLPFVAQVLLLAMAFLLELVLKHVHRRHRADGHLQVYRYPSFHTGLNCQLSKPSTLIAICAVSLCMLSQAH